MHCTSHGASGKVVSQVCIVYVDFFCKLSMMYVLYCQAQLSCVWGSIVSSTTALSEVNLCSVLTAMLAGTLCLWFSMGSEGGERGAYMEVNGGLNDVNWYV